MGEDQKSFTAKDAVREIKAATERIGSHARETWLEHSLHFSAATGASVYFKMENLQHTGSFKARGALNKVLSLSPDELSRGVVAASTGNHGAAVEYAAGIAGSHAVVFVPENASPDKLRTTPVFSSTSAFSGSMANAFLKNFMAFSC